jgi:hypothetical protein
MDGYKGPNGPQFTTEELAFLRRALRAYISGCKGKDVGAQLRILCDTYDKLLQVQPMAEEVPEVSEEMIVREEVGNEGDRTTVGSVGCDGMCEPTCAFCRKQADIAAENEVIEMGY